MSIHSFLKLVEIQTKVASMIPLSIGTVYAVFRFGHFDALNFLLMLLSLLSFDMCTTAINNYIDFKKAQKKYGYGYESHNAIVKYKLSEFAVLAVIFTLFFVAVTAGIMLVLQAGVAILLLGALSFAIGILYSFGPIPISRMPLGEIFSGLFMGFLIIFISTFIHVENPQLIAVLFESGFVQLRINAVETALIFLISIPAIIAIANIMLANNICDMEDDLANKRYTLPLYIGKEKALKLFQLSTYAAYIDLIVLYFLGVNPFLLLLVLLTLIPVHKHVSLFMANQSKEKTFVISVKNFIIMNLARFVIIGLSIFI